jgi:hypothetical protein
MWIFLIEIRRYLTALDVLTWLILGDAVNQS